MGTEARPTEPLLELSSPDEHEAKRSPVTVRSQPETLTPREDGDASRRSSEALLDARCSRDFAAGFFLTTLGVLTSVGVAAGWFEPQSGWVHPLNAPHVWLPYAAGLWFLRRCHLHEESQQRLEDRWRVDRRDQDRLAIFKDCEDKQLVANVVLALARANEAQTPAGTRAGPATEDITQRY